MEAKKESTEDFNLRQKFVGQLPASALLELIKTASETHDMQWLLPMEAAGVFRFNELVKTKGDKDLYTHQGFARLDALTCSLKTSKCTKVFEDPFTNKKVNSGAGICNVNISAEFVEFYKRIARQLLNDIDESKEPQNFNETYEYLKKTRSYVDGNRWVKLSAHNVCPPLMTLGCALGQREVVSEYLKTFGNQALTALVHQSVAGTQLKGIRAISPMVIAMAYGQTEIVSDFMDAGFDYKNPCASIEKPQFYDKPSINLPELIYKLAGVREQSQQASDYPFFLPSTLFEVASAWAKPVFDEEKTTSLALTHRLLGRSAFFPYVDAMKEAGLLEGSNAELTKTAFLNENFKATSVLLGKFDWSVWEHWREDNDRASYQINPMSLPFVVMCNARIQSDKEYLEQEGLEKDNGPAAPNLEVDNEVSKWCERAVANGCGALLTGSESNCVATIFAEQGLYRSVAICLEQGFDPDEPGHGEMTLNDMTYKNDRLTNIIDAVQRRRAALDVLGELRQLVSATP